MSIQTIDGYLLQKMFLAGAANLGSLILSTSNAFAYGVTSVNRTNNINK